MGDHQQAGELYRSAITSNPAVADEELDKSFRQTSDFDLDDLDFDDLDDDDLRIMSKPDTVVCRCRRDGRRQTGDRPKDHPAA